MGMGAPHGPAKFDPTVFSGCQLDLDAALSSYSGGTWADRSGAGHDFAQATGANRPTATTVNGFAALDFDGSNDSLRSAADAQAIITAAAYTVLVVCYVDAISSSGTAIQNDGLMSCQSGGFGLVVKNTPVAIAGNSPFIGDTKTVGTGAVTLVACRYNGTTVKVSVDGVDGAGDAEANATLGAGQKMDLGQSAQWSEFFDGKMLRVIAYNVSLSDPDWATAKAALKTQYGIA